MRLHNSIPGFKLARQVAGSSVAYGRFLADFVSFRRLSRHSNRNKVQWKNRYPCLDDRTATTAFDRHYVYHIAWAARTVAEIRPSRHIDISSSLFFVSGLSAFIPVKFYDSRPAELSLSDLSCDRADVRNLPFADRSVESISCMHVIGHVGLGRYGDPLDPDGDIRAMRELQRVVAAGGSLLVVTPLGKPRVCYNAHRIYSYAQIMENLPELDLVQFALIPDHVTDGGLLIDADPELVERQKYGCGCFWFQRQNI